MRNYESRQNIIREINKFLAMAPESANKVLTEQFAYIRVLVDTELGYESDVQQEVNKDAYNLMSAYSFDDTQLLHQKETMSVEDKLVILQRLRDRATQVKKLIQDNFLQVDNA